MQEKNLLFIPHTPPSPNLVTRGEALARGLASRFRVFLLSWRGDPTRVQSAPARVVSRLAAAFTRGTVHERAGISVVESPMLYVRRRGLELLRTINTRAVNKVIERHGIDVVVNELALVDSKDLRAPVIIDIVDLPSRREMARWSRQAAGAAGITTITQGLRAELAAHGMEAEVIPNGADLAKFRMASGAEVRDRLDLRGRFVIGYIGNHAEWSGLVFLLDVFKLVKRKLPRACLMIVGPGSEIPRAKAKAAREKIQDVVFTGPVPAQGVADYFQAMDLGVLPFELDPHAALSFPIKVIEYSAARKPVVASPLGVLRSINLPNVRIVDRKADLWAGAILECRATAWDPSWDLTVDAYDWSNISARLASFINSRIP